MEGAASRVSSLIVSSEDPFGSWRPPGRLSIEQLREAGGVNYGVITPTLNSGRTITEAIESVLYGVVAPAHYVFVDGGSRDDTFPLIRRALETAGTRGICTRFTIRHQVTSGGITEAWNLGLRELDTDLVFILGSDDWYQPDTAEKVLDCFKRNPEAEIVLGSGRYIGGEGNQRDRICKVRPFWVLPFAMSAIHPACFVKRSVYLRVGDFDTRYQVAADYEFIYRCYRRKVKFKRQREILVNVRRGGFAGRNVSLARDEALEIASKYCPLPALPRIAFWARAARNRYPRNVSLILR
jgi:glycosyltransferase involved in cell wall biosynthesis